MKSTSSRKSPQASKSRIANGFQDGSLSAATQAQARQELGISKNECLVTMSSWCGNLAVMQEVGPLFAIVPAMDAQREQVGGDDKPAHQVLLRSFNPRYKEMVGDILKYPCLGLAFLEPEGHQPTGALVLLGETYRIALCFDPLSPTYRQMLVQWKLTGQLCVRFENPSQGFSCEVFEARQEDAQAFDYLLALDVPANYQPDLVKTWLGMQAMEHCQLDPGTLFLLLVEECEIISNTMH